MASINWHSCFFLLFALLACAFAVGVVVAGNIVRMACYLVASLAAVAGLFFLAGADFVGAAQLMVYVGGTMVLLIFGVMLTARGPFVSMKTSSGQWVVAIFAGAFLLAMLLQAALTVPKLTDSQAATEPAVTKPLTAEPTAERLGLGLMGVRADQPGGNGEVALLQGGMSGHLLAFEIISIHLIVVLVGAAYLARSRRRVDPKGSPAQSAELSRLLEER